MYPTDSFKLEPEMSEKIFEAANHINLIITSCTGRILKANKAALEAYGYSLEELLNMNLFQLGQISEEMVDKLKEDAGTLEVKQYGKAGSCFWAEISSINISYKDEIVFVRIRDITEVKEREAQLIKSEEDFRILSESLKQVSEADEKLSINCREMKKLKEDAEAASRAKSQFLSNMSHEIRTPLNGINGMAQLLAETSITEEQREYIELLNQSSEHLLHIVDDILDISKIEVGKMELNRESFNLKTDLERLIKMYALSGYKKDVAVMLYYHPLLEHEFMGDVLRINQILVNLLGNALKFTEVGSVIINVKKIDEYENKIKLKFSVEDTGIGINSEFENKVFKLFNQGDSSLTKKYGGTGLGLAISRELVIMMNGEIWYESEVNKGTTFYFTIELEKQEKSNEIFSDNKVEEINLTENKNIKILIAEDNMINRMLICKYIEMRGYQYTGVSNGLEVLSLYEKEEFDLILMDIQMPKMNGIEVTKIIRDKEKNTSKHIPIIAMTSYAMKGDLALCIASGMDDYISKPLKLDVLKEKLKVFL